MPQPRHGTTRHDALSKIGPFSQIGAFQRYNRDKCSVSILPQMCDVTKASSNCVIEEEKTRKIWHFDDALYIVKLQHVFGWQSWPLSGGSERNSCEIDGTSSWKPLQMDGILVMIDLQPSFTRCLQSLSDHSELIYINHNCLLPRGTRPSLLSSPWFAFSLSILWLRIKAAEAKLWEVFKWS